MSVNTWSGRKLTENFALASYRRRLVYQLKQGRKHDGLVVARVLLLVYRRSEGMPGMLKDFVFANLARLADVWPPMVSFGVSP